MTVDAFITMALLASLSLVLFGAFPYRWEIGAVAVNTLNIVICAYCWYVIIAFTSFGTRDPYVYAMGGWVICFGSRSLARMLLYFTYPLAGNDLLINSLLGALVLISTQVVLVQFMHAERGESSAEKPIVWKPRTSGSRAKPKPMRPSRQRRWPKLSKRCRASCSTPRRREASAQQTASEALKAAEARQCIRCNEECAAIREQLLQIDPASSLPRFHALRLPPRRRCRRLSALQPSSALEPSPRPFPVHHGRAVRFHASQRGAHGRAFPAHEPRNGRAHPLRAWVTRRKRWPRSCSSPPPPPTATSSASTASAACTRARKSSSTSILTETEAERWKRNDPSPESYRRADRAATLERPTGSRSLPALARHSLRHHGRLLPRRLRHRLQRPQRRPRGDPRRSHRRQRRLLLARPPQVG